ncbi:ribonuclease P protein component [Alloscardovia macacae]|nr:ribonuclease P protein component [Alloscardovia macacae]
MERLQSHQDFTAVLRKRQRVSTHDIVVHFLVTSTPQSSDSKNQMDDLVSSTAVHRLGLAVSKSVGHAVQRNTVKRRFRVLARRYEHLLPAGYGIDCVMRAKPGCYSVPFSDLEPQVEKALTKIASIVESQKD